MIVSYLAHYVKAQHFLKRALQEAEAALSDQQTDAQHEAATALLNRIELAFR